MSSTDHIDFSTLTWVKSELDETLNRAKEALKAYVEDSEDINQLQFCVTYLHQVQGTLKMVELYGAAMVAEEMELVAKDLIDGHITDTDGAYDILLQSILRLPDYLERIELGHKDVPIVLLPLVNDLRAVRSQKLLSESALFNPNLALGVPDRLVEGDFSMSGSQLSAALTKIRTVYQVSLLNWIKQNNGDKALSNIQILVTKLQTLTGALHLKQLFWVYSAVIEGLRSDAIEDSVSVKQVAGQVDLILKELANNPALSVSKINPTTKNLLYFLAMCKGQTRLVNEVKDFFELEQFIPDEEEIKHAEGSLSGKNKDLLQTVSEAINDDVLIVQESLDLYIRNSAADIDELVPLLDRLQKIADTLGILGLGVARESVLLHSKGLKKAIDDNERPDDEQLLDAAKSLLMLESQLSEHIHNLGRTAPLTDEDENQVDHNVPKTEQAEILKQLAKESIVNLQQIKANFVAYIESPWDKDQIKNNPKLLRDIIGALKILQLDEASKQLTLLNNFIEDQIIIKKATPSAAELDQLATTISTFEYYLENLEQGRSIQNNLLDKVIDQVEKLQEYVTDISDVDKVKEEVTVSEDIASQPVETQKDVAEVVKDSHDTSPKKNVKTSSEDGEIVQFGEDVDEEFKEIFLEEYQEELVNLKDKHQKWQVDPENSNEEISEIRRIFHTLKGSGRMVGAELVGEFGWQMENMCNRFIDKAIEHTQAFEMVLSDGVSMAGSLFEALKSESTLPVNYDQQLEFAELVANGATQLPEVKEETLALDDDMSGLDFSSDVEEEDAVEEESSEAEETLALDEDLSGLDFSSEVEEEDSAEEESSEAEEALTLDDDLSDLDFSLDAEEEDSVEEESSEAEETLALDEDLSGLDFSSEVEEEDSAEEESSEVGEALASAEDNEAVLDLTDAMLDEDLTEVLSVDDQEDVSMENFIGDEDDEEQVSFDTDDEEIRENSANGDSDLSVDPVFIEILQNEVGGHIDALQKYLNDTDGAITEDFIRVVHTLNGAASMAEVNGITHMTSNLEKLSTLINEQSGSFNGEDINQIKKLVEHSKAIMADLGGGDYEADDQVGDYFIARIQELKAAQLKEEGKEFEKDTELASNDSVFEKVTDTHEGQSKEVVTEIKDHQDDEEEPEVLEQEEAVANLDDELLEIFSEEASEIFDRGEHLLAELDEKPDDIDIIQALQRDLHTLKGGARMAGLNQIGDLSHQLESLFESIAEKEGAISSGQYDTISKVMDKLHSMVTADDYGQLTSIESETQLLEKILSDEGAEVGEESKLDKEFFDPLNQSVSPIVADSSLADEEIDAMPTDVQKKKSNVLSGGQIKVNSELLDKLVNFAGEVSIYRSRMDQQSAELRLNIDELENTVERVRRLLRELEHETEAQIISNYQHEGEELEEDFDPLELDQFSTIQQLSRSLAESVSDLSNIQNYLQESARSSETLLLQQSRVNTELQEGLMETRLVTFNSLVPRLRRVLRTASSEIDKKAKLTVIGAEGEMDKTVLEGIQAPLEHMIRNSIVHGLESDRKAVDKPEQGNISIKLSREATEVVITVSDDGAGINTEVVKTKAIERGIIDADSALTEQEIAELITHSGLSAADKVTKLAGRGVGMDVVSNEIKRLGGSLEIVSRKGEGTTFVIRLPYTLALTQAIIVQVADHRYAIPASGVEGLIRMSYDEFKRRLAENDLEYDYAGDQYHIQELNKLLSVDSDPLVESGQVPLVMIKTGDQGVALRVDQTFGGREIVVKSVGTQVASVPGIFGATILGDGAVVLILDIIPMHRTYQQKLKTLVDQGVEVVDEVGDDHSITVMVVDDSITMRRAGERMLTRNDFEVTTAKDGIDALNKLQEQVPDMMLLDIEMPRMDGFELASEMKKTDKYKDIPIIMITSRTGQKHKDRAKAIGVDRYLGKPYQELELLKNIKELLNLEDV